MTDRRGFLAGGAAAIATAAATPLSAAEKAKAAPKSAPRSILNYNPDMEYRPLGKTGLMLSAICLGGHWKRTGVMLGPGFKGAGYMDEDFKNLNNPAFIKARTDVVNRCIELGINYVDACAPQEILAYSRVLKGRRDKMYFGFSWHTREPRYPEYRSGSALLSAFDQSLKEAGLDYVDLWRISLPMENIDNLALMTQIEEATMEALDKARQQGKARFTGVSSHSRVWLNSIVNQYPRQIQVVLFPYTASTKRLPDESIFDSVAKHGTGVLGIKPFADNSLFTGDSSPSSPHAAEDDRKARLALRYILGNPAITAPIPGLINIHQVENAAAAVKERRKLDRSERSELDAAAERMWANLRPGYEWLRNWQDV
jgi:aryl-alcohol dehydrogenase-like predicted oxidoreductase